MYTAFQVIEALPLWFSSEGLNSYCSSVVLQESYISLFFTINKPISLSGTSTDLQFSSFHFNFDFSGIAGERASEGEEVGHVG